MRTEIVSFNPINDQTSTLKTSIYIKPTLEIFLTVRLCIVVL